VAIALMFLSIVFIVLCLFDYDTKIVIIFDMVMLLALTLNIED
jgi:hypothetical protein